MGLLSSLFGKSKSGANEQEKQEKKNFDILKYDGIRARNMGKLPYAIKCFEEAVALQEETETLTLLASAYLQANRTEDARITLDRLIAKDATNVQALLSLASVCYIQEDYEGMDKACQKAIALDEKNAQAYYLAARAARGLKNDLQAIVMLTKAIVQNESFTEAYLLRAEVLWEMRQAKDALNDLEQVLKLNPEEEEALLLKATIHIGMGENQEGEACVEQVIALNPFNVKAYLLKGGLLIEEKQLDKALENYQEAIELIPQEAQLYQERGRVHLLMGDKAGAAEDMKKAIELAPEKENLISGNFNNFEKSNLQTGIY